MATQAMEVNSPERGGEDPIDDDSLDSSSSTSTREKWFQLERERRRKKKKEAKKGGFLGNLLGKPKKKPKKKGLAKRSLTRSEASTLEDRAPEKAKRTGMWCGRPFDDVFRFERDFECKARGRNEQYVDGCQGIVYSLFILLHILTIIIAQGPIELFRAVHMFIWGNLMTYVLVYVYGTSYYAKDEGEVS